jgi:hypothetical protein
MTLTPNFTTKTWTVTHDDGRTEPFQTRAAALIAYPVLGQQPQLTRQQERAIDRREARERGRNNGIGWTRSGRH